MTRATSSSAGLHDTLRDIGARDPATFYDAFRNVPDEVFCQILAEGPREDLGLARIIPGWANDAVRTASTGNFPFEQMVSEAFSFFALVKKIYAERARVPLGNSRVLDYGCGWGRIIRFFAKEVPPGALFGCDPNPVFMDICKQTNIPGVLAMSDWMSERNAFPGPFDLVYSFSILTHASERLFHNIVKRWQESTVPGSIVVCTVRPRTFLERDGGDMSVFTADEQLAALADYDNCRFVYKEYEPTSPHWGVTAVSAEYARRTLPPRLRLLEEISFEANWTQAIWVLQRI